MPTAAIPVERLEPRTHLATHTWVGGSGFNWSVAANWLGGAPTAAESDVAIVFDHTHSDDSAINHSILSVQNVANLTVRSVSFQAQNDVALSLTQNLTVSGQLVNDSGDNLIGGAAQLIVGKVAPDGIDVTASTNTELDVRTGISGAGGVFKFGAGALRLSGSAANTYAGNTLLSGGSLSLAKSGGADAVPAAGLSALESSGGLTVRFEAADQINDAALVQLSNHAVMQLTGFNESVRGLSLKAPSDGQTFVTTGSSGALTIGDLGVVVNTNSLTGPSTLSGNYKLNGQRTFDVGDGAAQVDLTLDGSITGTGGLTKAGSGTLRLTGDISNGYAGPTRVNAGTVLLAKFPSFNSIPSALEIGDGTGTDVVRLEAADQIADGAAVTLSASGRFELVGFNESIGPLRGDGVVSLVPVTFVGRLTSTVPSNTAETFGGTFVGQGELRKAGGGTLRVTHTLDNALLSVNVTTGQLAFDDAQRLLLMQVGAGAGVTLGAGSTTPGDRVLSIGSLTIASGGWVDVGNGGLIVDYFPPPPASTAPAELRGAIALGYAGGAWTGNGIRSNTAAAQSDKSVGFVDNDPSTGGPGRTTFMGRNVDATSFLIRFTFKGDADLNGSVGPEDFNLLASHFSQTGQTWATGDFNFDGTVGPGDFNLLATNFGKSFPPALHAATAVTRPPYVSTAPAARAAGGWASAFVASRSNRMAWHIGTLS